MNIRFLSILGGIILLSSAALADEVTCQSILAVGTGTFSELEAAGSCDVGNVTFSGFNTANFNPADLLVQTNGSAASPFGSILGFTYNYLGGVLPGGSVGYTATFDPMAATESAGGVACPVNATCGIAGLESQLNALVPSDAMVTTTHSGGYTGTSEVNASTLASETAQILIPLITFPGDVVKDSTYNGEGVINTFSTEVITGEVSNAPEPATTALLGGSLLLIGLRRRKRQTNQ